MAFDFNILVNALAPVAGALAGGWFTYLAARDQKRVNRLADEAAALRVQLRSSCDQVAAYHTLEGLYAAEIARRDGVADNTVKTAFRNQVEDAGFVRPTWTSRDAAKRQNVADGLPR